MKRTYLHLSLLLLMSFSVVAYGEVLHRYSFNDGDTTAVDSIGGADGTLEYDAYISGNQVHFDGTDDFVNLPGSVIAINTYTALTWELWSTEPTGDYWSMTAAAGNTWGNGNGQDYIFIATERADDVTRGAIANTPDQDSPWLDEVGVSGTEHDDGLEHHYVLTISDTELSFYIDGVAQTGSPAALGATTISGTSNQFFYLGKGVYTIDTEMICSINEFRIHDTALSPEEVVDSFNAGPDAAIGADNPTPTYPVGEENLDDYTPTLQWNDPINYEAALYYIYLDPNQANVKAVSKMVEPDPGSPLLVNVSQSGTEPNEYTVATELAHGERFYWKVEARKDYPGEDPNYFSSSVVSFTTLPDIPIITQHPASQTVPEGTEVTLTVVAIKPEDQDYQWYKDGQELSGETNSILTIASMAIEDEGYYYCKVSNDATPEGIPSNPARLMIQRLIVLWDFEQTIDPNYGPFTCTYFDPNEDNAIVPTPVFSNATPSPAGGYYVVFAGDSAETEDNNTGEAILTSDPNFFNFYPQGVTVSAWVQVPAETGWGANGWTAIVNKQDRSIPIGWALQKNPDYYGVFSARQTTTAWQDTIGTTDLTQVNEDLGNTWHMLTGTYGTDEDEDGLTDIRVYVDGDLENTAESANVLATHSLPLTIGAETSGGFSPWIGTVDQVEVYNYGLSQYEVAKLYLGYVPDAEICILEMSDEDKDINNDCIVDVKDLEIFAAGWLECNIVPTCIP